MFGANQANAFVGAGLMDVLLGDLSGVIKGEDRQLSGQYIKASEYLRAEIGAVRAYRELKDIAGSSLRERLKEEGGEKVINPRFSGGGGLFICLCHCGIFYPENGWAFSRG